MSSRGPCGQQKWAVTEDKIWVWEKFWQAMEEDYLSASKTIQSLRTEKQYSANTVDWKWGAVQDEQCGFCPGLGTLDQCYSLHTVIEGSWEFDQPVSMCFVDLEKAFDHGSRAIL